MFTACLRVHILARGELGQHAWYCAGEHAEDGRREAASEACAAKWVRGIRVLLSQQMKRRYLTLYCGSVRRDDDDAGFGDGDGGMGGGEDAMAPSIGVLSPAVGGGGNGDGSGGDGGRG